ncbi:MAG: hypothetical protein QOG15_1121 [Solirubrobacteraceae bacterium]|jgi:hypothetical protein|nr:hypothetical protein [Solirubrobacteraceae bacterium]
MKRNLLATALAVALIATPVALAGSPSQRHGTKAETIAVIGDIPYGDPLIAEFPADIQEINADPDVSRVLHLGDIKNGSSRCDTSYFQARLADFQTFDGPLVYTPGDNEWTDCHRANNGGYLPTERLATIRDLFFPKHGKTLGQHKATVDYQSDRFPENTMWEQAGIVLGMVHVVGSNDDQAPWFTDRKDAGGTAVPETPAEAALQAREFLPREAAAIRWIDKVFDAAQDEHAPGLVVGMQADMWDPTAEQSAFAPIKAVLADRAARFGKPVLLFEGDSHVFKVDTPPGMPANLTRVVVEGSTTTPHEWLRLHVDPSSPRVFSCENVVFVTKTVTPCPGTLAP